MSKITWYYLGAHMNHHKLLSKHKEEITYKNQDREMGRLSSGWISEGASRVAAVETVSDFMFWGSKITADGDCSHEIKQCFLLGRNALTHYFANNVLLVKL